MKNARCKFHTPIVKKIGIFLLFISLLSSCIKEDQAYTTFTGDMIYSFLKKDTTYSEYVKILNKSGLSGMLNAYGSYSCYAPSNKSFRSYYKSRGLHFTIDSLTQGQVDTIAQTHIFSNKYMTYDLSDGVIPTPNMNKRYIEIKFSTDSIKNTLEIILNGSARIFSKDNVVYNGVVHGIDNLLKPANYLLPELISQNLKLSIFNEALVLTRLCDSLLLVKDITYQPVSVFKTLDPSPEVINPAERNYAYTVFAEDNDVLNANGINSISDLITKAKEFYPCDAKYDNDFRNRNNSLNQYIAYHLVNKAIYYNKFFYTDHNAKNVIPYEFIETMLSNRVIKANLINREIVLNPNTVNAAIVDENESKTTKNGVYHLLNTMLVYTPAVETMLQNTRIRLDFTSLLPEMTNNGIRGSKGFCKKNTDGDRFGFETTYFKNLKMSKDTKMLYYGPCAGRGGDDFQADGLLGFGPFDITVRLLPVPPGTYELRFIYTQNNQRGITQIYFDNKPVGIPLNLAIMCTDPRVGYVADAMTDDNGVENDKAMRNRGFMKAPISYFNLAVGPDAPCRTHQGAARRIIGTYTFNDYEPHYIRFKSVTAATDREMILDYVEYVPKSIFNPVSGEPEGRD
jgi:uncharacterized surface protein with fasciclin (FAS1) repeats